MRIDGYFVPIDKYQIPLTISVAQDSIAFPDIHPLDTEEAKVSGWVFPDDISTSTINFKGRIPKTLSTNPNMKIRVYIMTQSALIDKDVRLAVQTIGIADTESLDQLYLDQELTTVRMPNTIETLAVYEQDLTINWESQDLLLGQLLRVPSSTFDNYLGNIMIVGIDLICDRNISPNG